MSEPTSGAIAGVAIATGAITLTGSVLGLQYDALLAGLAGGMVSLMHITPSSKLATAGTLAVSALLAALFSPLLMAGALHYVEWLQSVPNQAMRLSSSAFIGIFWQAVIPLVLAYLNRTRGKLNDKQGRGLS